MTLVPEIALVLLLCGGVREYVQTEKIAVQGTKTYPTDFLTAISGKKVPDLSAIFLPLTTGKGRQWRHVAVYCFREWWLTRGALRFAGDVERRITKPSTGRRGNEVCNENLTANFA